GLLVGSPGDPWKISEISLTPMGQLPAVPAAPRPTPPTDKLPSLGEVTEDQPPKPGITATEIATFSKHAMAVLRVVFDPSQRVLVSGGRDGKVLAWDLKTKSSLGELHSFGNREVWAMAFHPKKGVLAVANRDENGSKLLFKTIDGQPAGNEVADYGRGVAVAGIAYSRDGRLLATGQDNGTIRIWDLVQVRELPPLSFG